MPTKCRWCRSTGFVTLLTGRVPCVDCGGASRAARAGCPISAGYFHSLAVRGGGSIVAWGSNDSGQCDIPSPNADFAAVAAGVTTILA